MLIDSQVQPCPRCLRSTVLGTFTWGRQWVHTGTWTLECGPPSWAEERSQATAPHRRSGLPPRTRVPRHTNPDPDLSGQS